MGAEAEISLLVPKPELGNQVYNPSPTQSQNEKRKTKNEKTVFFY
jgi:hypothetical protein